MMINCLIQLMMNKCGLAYNLNIQQMSEQLDSLKTHLSIVKQLPADKIEEQFYNLMVKAKDVLGETSYPMATFYYEYGNFIISKLEKNMDIFNAAVVPNNVNEEAQENLEDIAEVYDDSDSNIQQNLGEQVQNAENAEQPPNEGDNEEQIDAAAVQSGNKQGEVDQQPHEEEEIDDKQISACNMELAITIFQTQLQKVRNCQSQTPIKEILDGIRRAKTRLGDLYMLDEEYPKAVDQYRSVIAQEQQREDSECSRLIAELHFLIGNCFLYDNKQGCENLAIQQFIKAVNILVNNLSLVENYDISAFEIPCKDKYQVDRFAYLNKPNDSDNVKEIKDIITCLLDKIEDTASQIGDKIAYESEKKREQQEKKKSQFKPVEQGTKVINLGNFGNRKKKPEDISIDQSKEKFKDEK